MAHKKTSFDSTENYNSEADLQKKQLSFNFEEHVSVDNAINIEKGKTKIINISFLTERKKKDFIQQIIHNTKSF
jgi:hypothetical protein